MKRVSISALRRLSSTGAGCSSSLSEERRDAAISPADVARVPFKVVPPEDRCAGGHWPGSLIGCEQGNWREDQSRHPHGKFPDCFLSQSTPQGGGSFRQRRAEVYDAFRAAGTAPSTPVPEGARDPRYPSTLARFDRSRRARTGSRSRGRSPKGCGSSIEARLWPPLSPAPLAGRVPRAGAIGAAPCGHSIDRASKPRWITCSSARAAHADPGVRLQRSRGRRAPSESSLEGTARRRRAGGGVIDLLGTSVSRRRSADPARATARAAVYTPVSEDYGCANPLEAALPTPAGSARPPTAGMRA